MKTGVGSILIDGVEVGEATIDALGPSVGLSAKLAYVNSKTGARLGFCNTSSWSPNTLTKLRELLDAMEEDVVSMLFGDAASSGGGEGAADTSGGVPGL